MLRELHISGLGVIEDLDLELDPGLNVLTGETGAGKTMITVGLAIALGGRASASLVRAGAKAARVQARFDAPPGAEAGAWVEDGELLLARSVGADGKSAARIGGQLAPVSALAELSSGLVEMHGQHQGLRLLSGGAQTEFLDRFAGPRHTDRVRAFGELHRRLREARARSEELASAERERERELDLLDYQIREIEAAGIKEGELAELQTEEARLTHAERLLERMGAAEAALAEEGAGADALRLVAAALEDAGQVDPEAAELAARATGLAEEAGQLARDVRACAERITLDPARLEEVRERIQAMKALERKYGEGEAEVLAFLDRALLRRASLSGADEERRALEAEAGELSAAARKLAAELAAAREKSAPRLAAALSEEMSELGMEGAEVRVTLVPLAEPGPAGGERAELLFSGGPGQPLLPLSKVASGGELSRTMLACRSVMVDLDDVPTLVFDEVDAGIGGRAAVAVGRRLARLAQTRQVLVVTHLPQIASFADRHVRVEKAEGTAAVTVVEGDERIAELSRMLSGLSQSEVAAVHAEELLAEAGRAKARR